MEPANGFEPLTCAFRVRLREISRRPWTLRSLKTRIEPSLRRRMGIPKNPDRGERAPRVPQRKDRVRIAEGRPAAFSLSGSESRFDRLEAERPADEMNVLGSVR